MRVLRLYLKNYANIYNALGRTEINVDFSKCRNRICTFRSENGSGKSSILNEINPFFSNSNVFMYDTEIKKVIDFGLDDGTIVSITYTGWRSKDIKGKPTRCYIKRIYPDKKVELNPNGNITSGRDIIFNLFDLNDDYLALSSISANKKGIGSMTPSERKRFVSVIISSISPFIEYHKLFSSKSTVLKSMINSITTKLSQIGNIESITQSTYTDKKELETLNNKKESLIKDIASFNAKLNLLSKDGNPMDIYKDLVSKKAVMEYDIKNIPEYVLQFTDKELLDKEKGSSKLESKIDSINEQLKSLSDKESDIRSKLESSKIELNSLFDKNLMDSIINKINSKQQELSIYIKYFESIGFKEYENITEQEYDLAVDAIDKFNKTIISLGDKYTDVIRKEAVQYINKDYEFTNLNKVLNDFKTKLEKTKDIITTQTDLQTRSKDYNSIPKDCNHLNDCPFINSIVSARQSMISSEQLEKLKGQRDELISSIQLTEEEIEKQNNLASCISEIKYIVNYVSSLVSIVSKFPNTEKIGSIQSIVFCILNVSPLPIDISKYVEYSDYITRISSCEKDIRSLNERLEKLKNSNKESFALQRSIEMLASNLKEVTDSKVSLMGKLNDAENSKSIVDKEIQALYTNKKAKERYETISQKLKEIDAKIKDLETNVKEYEFITDKVLKLNNELNTISNKSIPELSNKIEQASYRMVLYDQYKQDYTKYASLYDKLQMVKNATSINGIQAVMMEMTLNEIIATVNQLSALMFNGRFILQQFVITENEFRIPCYDTETREVRPDISLMSDSQLSELSMMISFVLLHQASKKYNIIRLDEVDDNLDNDNRLGFSSLVNKMMDLLHFDQCFIISHNNELDLSNCDMIITRMDNVEMYNGLVGSGANIIADFTK